MPITIPNINQWLSTRLANIVSKQRGYITLPAFSQAVTYIGVAEIVRQYNYSVANDFVIKNFPFNPSNPDYILCIKYRIGNTVYRYKLWDRDGVATTLDFAPVYSGQVIKKNFTLEIWNQPGQTSVTQVTALTFTLSLLRKKTLFSDSDSYEATSAGDPVTDLGNTNTSPDILNVTDAIFRWSSEGASAVGTTADKVDSWTDLLFDHIFTGTDPDRPTYIPSVTQIANKYAIGVDNDGDFLLSNSITEDLLHVFMVCRIKNLNTDDANILSGTSRTYFTTSFSSPTQFQITSVSGGDGVAFDIPTGEYTDWMILEILIDGGTNETYVRFTDFKGNTSTVTTEFASDIFNAGELTLGFVPSAGGVLDVAEILGFSSLRIGAEHTAIINYYNIVYGGMTLPLTYTEEQHGQNNT